jgi:1-acyl-sn-glycerol-3-phosphate acyltransferase
MEHLRRYQFLWRTFYPLVAAWIKRKFRYDPEICTAEGPFLVLCNHNTDWDPLLLACAFPNYMSFVATETIFRWRFAGRLIIALMGPIARLKGKTAADTAMTMLRRLRKGISVAMFAEGNRSFNGLTNEILPATGKLARSSGVKLITYRLEGGYFTSPRWSDGLRRGKMTGRVVRIYMPEELKAMRADEVNAAIRRDLSADAYAMQRKLMIPFRGKNLAEHLETVLCICPRCGAMGTLKSEGDTLRCACGFSVRYTEYGFLEGDGAPFDNITDWDRVQTEKLIALAEAAGDGPIFSDDGMDLKEVFPDTHTDAPIGSGSMTLYADRLECCGQVFPLDALGGFSLVRAQTVDLSCGGRFFEITSPKVRCTRKYMIVIDHLKQKR